MRLIEKVGVKVGVVNLSFDENLKWINTNIKNNLVKSMEPFSDFRLIEKSGRKSRRDNIFFP